MASAPTGHIDVAPERGRADRKTFLDFPYRLYRGHPTWVPPVRMADAKIMDQKKNPFFAHAEAEHFLARRDGRVVGRIAACVNRLHNEVHGDRVGFFGWFDVEPDPEAATALVAAARVWVGARGMTSLRGPVCYSTNDVCGVLIEGFEQPPMLMMPWNRPDYDALLLGAGLVKAKDLVAYWIPSSSPIPERYVRVTDRALARGGFTLRDIDLRRWRTEVDTIKSLYNRSWERNWGFVPMTDAEFEHAAKDLKQILDPRMFMMIERGGTPVGFAGILPDVNEALVGLDGRLFPFGLFKLLRRMKRIRNVRIVLLGVVPEARGRGVDAAVFVRALTKARECGYAGGEASWILEDNARMRADVEGVGAKVWKRYRLYEGPVPAVGGIV